MKQVMVIGLGQFGSALARALTGRGVEVLAVDRDAKLVNAVASVVTQAVCFDATDESILAKLTPEVRDVSVVAIGPEARDASIVCTALLRQMGAPRIIARASDPLHGRILRLVGANEIVNPEEAFGERLASRLAFGVLDQVPLGEDLVLTELKVPQKLVGRTLIDADLPRRFGVTVVAIRGMELGRGQVIRPTPAHVFREEDILVVAASQESIRALIERFE